MSSLPGTTSRAALFIIWQPDLQRFITVTWPIAGYADWMSGVTATNPADLELYSTVLVP